MCTLLSIQTLLNILKKHFHMNRNISFSFCRSYVSIQFSKTCLFVAELSFAYFLMLIAMTYNTWLFVAVVIGRGLGYCLVTPLIGSYIDSDDIDYHSYSDLWQDSPHPADI